jgi:putative CocE/NonD family hydrolase
VVRYNDRASRDERLLTYTSEPLEADTEVTGHPVVTLQVASTATDGAFFAYLEEVTPDGDVTYVTEGALRALHRRLAPEPDALGLPRHTFRRADARPLVPGEVAELTFDLQPISYRFAAGSRIRLARAGGGAGHCARVPAAGDVAWRVQRNAARATSIVLPVVAPPDDRAAR